MESEAFTKERIWHGAILCSGFEENEQKMFDSITLSRLGLEQNEQKSRGEYFATDYETFPW